jgi:O-acetyl-ADP-ribose deacetylase (regulator of RNase III)
MIHEVSGDILLSGASAIAHGVSAHDHFDQGLALALRERWPSMAKDFKHWSHQASPKPGTAWIWSGAGGVRIVCLVTQEDATHNHGNHAGKSRTEYVNHALKELRKIIEKEKLTSISLPKLATGAGRLDWSEVAPLIQHHLGDLDVPVYVYVEYHKDQAANELSQTA